MIEFDGFQHNENNITLVAESNPVFYKRTNTIKNADTSLLINKQKQRSNQHENKIKPNSIGHVKKINILTTGRVILTK